MGWRWEIRFHGWERFAFVFEPRISDSLSPKLAIGDQSWTRWPQLTYPPPSSAFRQPVSLPMSRTVARRVERVDVARIVVEHATEPLVLFRVLAALRLCGCENSGLAARHRIPFEPAPDLSLSQPLRTDLEGLRQDCATRLERRAGTLLRRTPSSIKGFPLIGGSGHCEQEDQEGVTHSIRLARLQQFCQSIRLDQPGLNSATALNPSQCRLPRDGHHGDQCGKADGKYDRAGRVVPHAGQPDRVELFRVDEDFLRIPDGDGKLGT